MPLLPLLPFYFYKGNMLEVLILKAYTLVTHRNIDNRINLRDRKMLNVNKAIVMGD